MAHMKTRSLSMRKDSVLRFTSEWLILLWPLAFPFKADDRQCSCESQEKTWAWPTKKLILYCFIAVLLMNSFNMTDMILNKASSNMSFKLIAYVLLYNYFNQKYQHVARIWTCVYSFMLSHSLDHPEISSGHLSQVV